VIVLDSSAMLAYLGGEPGEEVVTGLLDDPDRDVPVYAHAANLCEVFYHFLRATDAATAEQAIADLKADGVTERRDMDAAFWRDVGVIIADQRSQRRPLAFGDAFGLALARREGGDFYTADRHEMEAVAADSVASIVFIR
jgi:predicted nucleic acid-binding protein